MKDPEIAIKSAELLVTLYELSRENRPSVQPAVRLAVSSCLAL
jgi:hypothetical protein